CPWADRQAMSMDARRDRMLLLISGTGGLGKTAIAAALGVMAARHDRRVLVAEVEGKNALSNLLASPPLTSEPRELRPGLWAMHVSPEESLSEYFEVQFHAKRAVKPLVASQLVYYVTYAAPRLLGTLLPRNCG